MAKIFNVTGDCKPKWHYMVDLSERMQEIKKMVDAGQYFTINRARQYGKTTTIRMLGQYLQEEYEVVSLDFQMMSHTCFESEQAFVSAFSAELLDNIAKFPMEIGDKLNDFAEEKVKNLTLQSLFRVLSAWCDVAERKVVLLIDEVDSATNNQVFLDFLAQLRSYYLKRDIRSTFQSVILAGVYDVKNIKRKIRPDEEHKVNSTWNKRVGNESGECLHSSDDCPWDYKAVTPYNIAADFCVDMSLSAKGIAGMLADYEEDYHTGMDIAGMAELLRDYTSGYPVLVSRLCKLMDERIAGSEKYPGKSEAWTRDGFQEALKILLDERTPLFESLINKLNDYSELSDMVYTLLFTGKSITYSSLNPSIEMAEMFGFVKNAGGRVAISNRIFETVLYNYFISREVLNSKIYDASTLDKNRFIDNGYLNMKLILERFVVHFHDLYGSEEEVFLEEVGRRYFLLYLKPIINGTGNYYVEAETRDRERTDVIVDYHGEQFVIELKIWRGEAYNTRGEAQLAEYLDYYHLEKGYMLSFNFNQKKEIGIKEIALGNKVLVEAVV